MNSPGEGVREFYRRQGEQRERARLLYELQALRRTYLRLARNNPEQAEEQQQYAEVVTHIVNIISKGENAKAS